MGKKKASLEELKTRTAGIFATLGETYPDAKCSLDFKTPYELLVATVLSAQCTDVRVNMVTPALFKKYPNAKALAKAKLPEVEQLIRSTGFYKNKAKSIVSAAQAMVAQHGGDVPKTMEELVELGGVGRKTANVILSNAFGLPGLPVDTHVGRLSRRLGLTQNEDPVKVELDLMLLLDPAQWGDFSHLLIYHGRARCDARKPDCAGCEIGDLCPRIGVISK